MATENSLAEAPGGSRDVKSGNPLGPKITPPAPPDPPMRLHNEMVLVSSVTAPVCAQAAPQVIVAPVFRVMLVCARMSPANDVVVPSVAELPTRQNTLPPCAPLISEIPEALAVVSVLPILKMKTELGLPRPLSVRRPVNWADELKL